MIQSTETYCQKDMSTIFCIKKNAMHQFDNVKKDDQSDDKYKCITNNVSTILQFFYQLTNRIA